MGRNRNINAKGRREHEPFIKITRNLYDSPAWADLSPCAVRVYLEIRRRFNGLNNGEISLSVREAAEVAHCGKGTASRVFGELRAHGLIKTSSKGHFSNRHATTWTLTNESPKGGGSPSNEWKQWPSKF